MRRVARLIRATVAVGAVCSIVVPAASADTTTTPSYVQPYGAGTVAGFYNVLPPGENGLVTSSQYLQYQSNGDLPANSQDQLSLYENLLYASKTLTNAQIPNYFVNATFGVQTQDVTRTETPSPGVTIIRDEDDVPHIYGQTRADVMFGAGYAAAEDRLFLMDVLRHTAEADLSSFLGGSAGNRASDEAQWTVAPYSKADLQKQISDAPKLYGKTGERLISDVTAYVNGINAYIAQIRANPSEEPVEYVGFNQTPQPWQATDVVAVASLVGAIFGKGGGNEMNSALTEEAFVKRFGTKAGETAWENFREANDPQSPTTVSKRFPYETGSPFSAAGLAMPVSGTTRFVSPGQTNPVSAHLRRATPAGTVDVSSSSSTSTSGSAAATATSGAGGDGYTDTPDPIKIPDDGSIGAAMVQNFYGQQALASNWELVSAKDSADGHAIGVLGPQVGYYAPQILMQEDLHGPGIDADGAAFPGVNLYVELGHGNDYAWSATTATSDNVDTFAEVLCDPSGSRPSSSSLHYLWHGKCLAMQKLTRTDAWTPSLETPTAAGSATLTSYRTVHGIVYARGEVSVASCASVKVPKADCIGTKRIAVAFTTARTTYMHEIDSAIGFSDFNDPSDMQTPKAFQKAASHVAFAFNWGYVNANHIAYYTSGSYPVRAADSSPDFPILGTGAYDWKGFDAKYLTEQDIPTNAHPEAIDPGYMVSWNNKQAPGWAASDSQYGYGAVFRQQLIAQHIRQDLSGGHKVTTAQLVQSMELAATEDIREVKLWPLLRKVIGKPSSPALAKAVSELNAWYRAGGHRWDLTKSGSDSNTPAIEVMDAWWPKLLAAEFEPRLGPTVFKQLENMIGFGTVYTGIDPNEPDMEEGWYSYVDKDLEDLLAARSHTKVPGAYSEIYCGDGSLSACRKDLDATLTAATKVSAKSMYGHGICASDPQPSCYDQDESTDVSAIDVSPFPFQNRPTFQQVVELTSMVKPGS